ncbi:NAD(+) diphosphatase [Nocardioides dubius]|uniref:NAD(+) diphosphatase n=1 Tax=Nocardioides dubius TaxID=317019 RepID=A0ABN1U1A4_9ACTN
MSRTLPHVALSKHPHDRHGLRRDDTDWVATKWADPATRVLPIAGTRIRPVDGALDWVRPDQAPDGTRVLLGERDGVTYFAVLAPPPPADADRAEWLPLRGVLGLLGDADLGPLVLHAIGLAEWHWVTRFCPRCGGALEARQEGHVLRCLACAKEQFPRTDPAVIMVVTDGEPGSAEERCLLGRSPQWPEGRFSTLAGFVEPGETIEDAVRREVFEETGVTVGEVRYFDSQPWPLPASLMIGFIGRAVSTQIDVDGSEIAEARWFTRAQMRAEAEAGTLKLPSGVSISRSLIETWYGDALPGIW